jgi:serine/threonine-protein kinase
MGADGRKSGSVRDTFDEDEPSPVPSEGEVVGPTTLSSEHEPIVDLASEPTQSAASLSGARAGGSAAKARTGAGAGASAVSAGLARAVAEAHTSFAEGEEDDPFGDMQTGTELGGRYRLEKILGRGATGVVFVASHLVIGKRVALKCLYPHHRASPNAVERFFREARIAATVEHPNVIQVFDGGDEKDTLFLAMELLEGESLGDRLERGALPVDEAISVFLGIMDGVAAVHAHGVVHRDLKPDNVFLTRAREGRPSDPKVLDFGISKLKEPGLRELTSLGTVMGTPYYMAPEQVTNTRDVDERADVYSLGVMLYEALSGDIPYYGESVLDIFRAAQQGGAAPLDRVCTDVPPLLAGLVQKAMSPKREDRYRTVREMHDELRSIVLGDTDPTTATPPIDVRRTVQDMTSPFADGAQPRFDRATGPRKLPPIPSPHQSGFDLSQLPKEDHHTTPLERPTYPDDGLAMPRWALITLIAAGVVTFGAVITAIVALLT